MSINTRLENERGEALVTLASPSWLTKWMLLSADLQDTVCLRFIDPYGDTVFNRAQMKVLVEELAKVLAGPTDERVERAYDEWLGRFAKMDAAIQEYARNYPKPSTAALRDHIAALQDLARKGAEASHLYLHR